MHSDIVNKPKEGRTKVTYLLCILAHNILIRKALLVEALAIHHYAGPSKLRLLRKKKEESPGLDEQSDFSLCKCILIYYNVEICQRNIPLPLV